MAHLYWVFPLKMVIFHCKLLVHQRVYQKPMEIPCFSGKMIWKKKGKGLIIGVTPLKMQSILHAQAGPSVLCQAGTMMVPVASAPGDAYFGRLGAAETGRNSRWLVAAVDVHEIDLSETCSFTKKKKLKIIWMV